MQQSLCQDSIPITLENEELLLLCEKAIYWKKHSALLIADLHIGKVTHFRNNNIPIPQQAAEKNFVMLDKLLLQHKPKTVIFLGDLFHSYYNKEWEKLIFTLARHSKIKFELITGNHDILKNQHYINAGITCFPEKIVGPFRFTHHPEANDQHYNLCGHLHPGVKMRGNGRQYMKLPCFYFGPRQGILPAFGNFTGTAPIKVKEGDEVYAVLDGRILHLTP